MAQIAANDCSGPQQEMKGYQQKSSGAQRPANGCTRWELPCQGRGRGFESLRPLQNLPKLHTFMPGWRNVSSSCDFWGSSGEAIAENVKRVTSQTRIDETLGLLLRLLG